MSAEFEEVLASVIAVTSAAALPSLMKPLLDGASTPAFGAMSPRRVPRLPFHPHLPELRCAVRPAS
eukprot:4459065-Alexandrium_andersonii.AAC.1